MCVNKAITLKTEKGRLHEDGSLRIRFREGR
jgi:hypothetical protein